MKRRADLIWALAEGSLLLALGAISWATRQPLIFASLGPTAYELVEQPRLRSARPYNIIVGHLTGLASGFLSIYLFNAWKSPPVSSAGVLTTDRLWVAALAAALTTVLTLMLRAGQPAALATTLLVALGLMQTRRDAIAIIAGVIILAAIGEPLRRLRLKILELRSMAATPIPR
ncbi:MAG: HPP family protein [Candidatus Acidiferrales bacterium]